jgi:hypothetical protein
VEIQVQQSSNVRVSNGVFTYPDGSKAALLFMRAGDTDTMEALDLAFRLHGASPANLTHGEPDIGRAAGECEILDGGVTVILRGVAPGLKTGPRGMLGLEFTASWGSTVQSWTATAQDAGHVWVGLLTEADYELVWSMNPVMSHEGDVGQAVDLTEVPSMPVLKLPVRRG